MVERNIVPSIPAAEDDDARDSEAGLLILNVRSAPLQVYFNGPDACAGLASTSDWPGQSDWPGLTRPLDTAGHPSQNHRTTAVFTDFI